MIHNRSFCADLMKLSPQYQTYACEAFHSVVNQFAPKSTAFTYNGMLSRYCCHNFITMYKLNFGMFCRLYLASLHYNENCNKKQAETKKGERRYSVLYPKYKGGGYIVRKLVEDVLMVSPCCITKNNNKTELCTLGYVDDLFSQLQQVVKKTCKQIPGVPSPPPLCRSNRATSK